MTRATLYRWLAAQCHSVHALFYTLHLHCSDRADELDPWTLADTVAALHIDRARELDREANEDMARKVIAFRDARV